jgi:hypothetical protein
MTCAHVRCNAETPSSIQISGPHSKSHEFLEEAGLVLRIWIRSVRFSHGRKAKSPKGIDPVSKAVAEDEGWNYRQKAFVNALKNGPGNCQGGR